LQEQRSCLETIKNQKLTLENCSSEVMEVWGRSWADQIKEIREYINWMKDPIVTDSDRKIMEQRPYKQCMSGLRAMSWQESQRASIRANREFCAVIECKLRKIADSLKI
jgi:hypothetical protein